MGQNNKTPILSKNTRKTAAEFSKILGITVLEFRGQFDAKSYNDENIRLDEYLNRISNCKIEKPDSDLSRRSAAQLKKFLTNKLD